VIQKVLAYITRQRNGRIEVLVFEHRDFPEAGVQVPAGTVERGESVEQALYREIEEESGLGPAQLRLRGQLAEAHDPATRARRHFFHLEAAGTLPEAWPHTVRGQGEDQGMTFLYHWAGLDVALVGGQDQCLPMLEAVR
jgi:ADP-ribose pyrophosphatase YjhB (NUDIX family)